MSSRLAFGMDSILSSPRKMSPVNKSCNGDTCGAVTSSLEDAAVSLVADQCSSSKRQQEARGPSPSDHRFVGSQELSPSGRSNKCNRRKEQNSQVDTTTSQPTPAPSSLQFEDDRCGDSDDDYSRSSSMCEDDDDAMAADNDDSYDSYTDSHHHTDSVVDSSTVSQTHSSSDAIANLRRKRDAVTSSCHASTRFSVTDILHDTSKRQQRETGGGEGIRYNPLSTASLMSSHIDDVKQSKMTTPGSLAALQSPVKSPGTWPYGHVLPWLSAPPVPGLTVNSRMYY